MANMGTGQGPAAAVGGDGAPGVFERPDGAVAAGAAECAESTGPPGRENFAAPAGPDACAGFPAGFPAAFPGLAAAAVAAAFAACDSFGPADGLGRWDLGLRDAARLRAMLVSGWSIFARYCMQSAAPIPTCAGARLMRFGGDSRATAATTAATQRDQPTAGRTIQTRQTIP